MVDSEKRESDQWLIKANNDLRSAEQLLKAEPPLNSKSLNPS